MIRKDESVAEGSLTRDQERFVAFGFQRSAFVGPSRELVLLIELIGNVDFFEEPLLRAFFMQHLGLLIILFPLSIILQYFLHHKFLLTSIFDLLIAYNKLQTRGVSNLPVAALNLFLHV